MALGQLDGLAPRAAAQVQHPGAVAQTEDLLDGVDAAAQVVVGALGVPADEAAQPIGRVRGHAPVEMLSVAHFIGVR